MTPALGGGGGGGLLRRRKTGRHLVRVRVTGRHLVLGPEPDVCHQTRPLDPTWPLEAIFTPLILQICFVNLLIFAVLTSQSAC